MYKGKYYLRNRILFIPEKIYDIPEEEFKEDNSFDEVIISKNVVSIGVRAFGGCTSLKKVTFKSESGCLFLFNGCFEFCLNLRQIDLPQSLIEIGESVFSFNSSLKEIILPSSVEAIGRDAFRYCGVEKVRVLNPRLKHIGIAAFLGTNLESVYFRNKKNKINYWEGQPIALANNRNFQDLFIEEGFELSSFLCGKKDKFYRVSSGKTSCVGESLRAAFNEYQYNTTANMAILAKNDEWTLDTEIDMAQYCAISQNCWYYTKKFLELNNIDVNSKMSIRKILSVSKNQRNYDVFVDFVKKNVMGGEAYEQS